MAVATSRGCPKCGAPRAGQSACPKCGLLANRMLAFEKDREASVPESVRAAWDKVAADWGDPAGHDALFALTAEHQVYAWTAARYREARAGQPDGATDPHLERMRKAAEATLMVTATANRAGQRQPYVSSIIVLALVGFMIFIGLILAMYMRGNGPRAADVPAANSAGSPAAASSQVR